MLSRRAPFRHALPVAACAALFAGLAIGGITVSANPQHFAAIWLSNAVLLGALLRAPRERQAALLIACFTGSIGANLVCGIPPARTLAFSALNVAEAGAAFLLLARGRDRWLELANIRDLVRFSAVGLGVPLCSGFLAMLILSAGSGAVQWAAWPAWWATAALGLLIGTPLVLAGLDALRSSARPAAGVGESAAVMGVCLLGAAAVFAQPGYPLLFLVGPLVVLAAFRLGITGTALVIAGIAAIGIAETASGHGPVALIVGGMATKLLILQLFFLTCFAMGLPVNALLAGLARARAELKERRDFGQSMLENMREVIFRTDAAGRWIFLNSAWENLTGHPVAGSLGRSSAELLHPDDLAGGRAVQRRLFSGEIADALVRQRFHTADGACRHVEISVRALRDANGRFEGTIGNIRDVTEATLSEQALRDSERRFHTLATLAPVGLFRTDRHGAWTFVNQHFLNLSGQTEEQALGLGWMDGVLPDDRASIIARSPGLIAARASSSHDVGFRHPDGSIRWVHYSAAPLIDEDGEFEGFLGITIDITERKALELDLATARDVAEVAAQAKADFLANMSHEIRTPMNGVIGFTELLLGGEVTPEQRRYLQMIADSGRAMMRLLNDILDLSKIEAGHMAVAAEPMNPAHSVRGCLQLMVPLATRKGLTLACHREDGVPARILGDDLRFRQILLNLLGNAVKFTETGSVDVHLSVVGGDRLEVEVRDTGIGIAPERRERIFDQFVQADVSIARRYGGTGLGLAISGRLARLMGGSLRVESVEGEGTSFFLCLPLVPVEAAAMAPAPALPAPAPVAPGGVGPRVLLAEDHEINQLLATAMLDRLGARSEVARDGAEAVAAVARAMATDDPFALVLMDMQMPGVDGLEATRRIRAGGVGADRLPIVALTANAFDDDVAACLQAGMQAHIAKPLQLAALAEVLRAWTGERMARAA